MEIVKEPNDILHRKLEAVDKLTDQNKQLIQQMREKMVEEKGIGLAANQIGENIQIFVIDKKLAGEYGVPDVYVNPEIYETSKELSVMEEGCLSLPEYWNNVERPKKIKLKAIDGSGDKIKIKARGILARVLQHEYDHLQGVLIKDHGQKSES